MKCWERIKAWWIRRKARGRYSPMYGAYVNTPEYWERRREKLYEIIDILNREDAERERKKKEQEEKEKQKMEKKAEKAKRKMEKKELKMQKTRRE